MKPLQPFPPFHTLSFSLSFSPYFSLLRIGIHNEKCFVKDPQYSTYKNGIVQPFTFITNSLVRNVFYRREFISIKLAVVVTHGHILRSLQSSILLADSFYHILCVCIRFVAVVLFNNAHLIMPTRIYSCCIQSMLVHLILFHSTEKRIIKKKHFSHTSTILQFSIGNIKLNFNLTSSEQQAWRTR